jgi:ATP-dependent DNA helicase RecQ
MIVLLSLHSEEILYFGTYKIFITYLSRDSCCSMSNIKEEMADLIKQLKVNRKESPRTIIFCQTLQICSEVYETFQKALGADITHPPNAPNRSRYRLVDMYTSVTDSSVKHNIESSIKVADGILQVLACTTAFGMGVDCKGVSMIIHWGPPDDIEGYIQEVGRGGRGGETTEAKLFYNIKKLANADKAISEYCTNTSTCRREKLLSHFPEEHPKDKQEICACCDICRSSCNCGACTSV